MQHGGGINYHSPVHPYSVSKEMGTLQFVPIRLKAYEDPDQTSEASKIAFEIQSQIKRGNKWMNRNE